MIRRAVVAGPFYPGTPERLRAQAVDTKKDDSSVVGYAGLIVT